jgi:hypothetical protein
MRYTLQRPSRRMPVSAHQALGHEMLAGPSRPGRSTPTSMCLGSSFAAPAPYDHLGNAARSRQDPNTSSPLARERRDGPRAARLEELGSILAAQSTTGRRPRLFDEALHLAEVSGGPRGAGAVPRALSSLVEPFAFRPGTRTRRARMAIVFRTTDRPSSRRRRSMPQTGGAQDRMTSLPAKVTPTRCSPSQKNARRSMSAQFCPLELGLIRSTGARMTPRRISTTDGMNRRVRDDGYHGPAHLAVRLVRALAGSMMGPAWNSRSRPGTRRCDRTAEWTAWSAIYRARSFLDSGRQRRASGGPGKGASASRALGAEPPRGSMLSTQTWPPGSQQGSGGSERGSRRADDVFVRVCFLGIGPSCSRGSVRRCRVDPGDARRTGRWLRLSQTPLSGCGSAMVSGGGRGRAKLCARPGRIRAGWPEGAESVPSSQPRRRMAQACPENGVEGPRVPLNFPGRIRNTRSPHADVADLTSSLTVHTLAEVLRDTLERELGGSTMALAVAEHPSRQR